MKHLPLFYYPTTWLCIDDDSLITASVSNVMGKYNHLKCFQAPRLFLDYLGNYQSFLTNQSFLHANTDNEYYGTLEYSSVNFNVTDIVKLVDLTEKHSEISAIIMDYKMPEMDGFCLAEKCNNLAIPILLLTGEVKLSEAINGFNNNLINCFINKGDDSLFDNLLLNLQKLTYQFFQAKTLPLLTHLEADTLTALSDPHFIQFFEKYCKQYDINEYYLIDKQGSFLCIDKNGKKYCFVVQTERSLTEWLNLYEDDRESISSPMKLIKQRGMIPFFGIGVETWRIPASQWSQHYYSSQVMKGREHYYWAHVEI